MNNVQNYTVYDLYNASSSQKRLFALYEMDKSDINYNISSIVETEEYFNEEILSNILKKLVQRHEALRTVFEIVDGQIIAKVLNVYESNIEITKYDGQGKDIDTIVKSFIQPFNLNVWPLFRVALIEFDKKSWIVFDIHHIAADGTALYFLLDEMISLYKNMELKDVKAQYKDYAVWQSEFGKSEENLKQREYWLSQFDGDLPVLNLPYDYRRSSTADNKGDRIYFKIDSSRGKMIHDIAKSYSSTPFTVLLAAYYILLSKYSNQEDIVIGSVSHGRTQPQFRKTIGMFVNTLALRNYPKGTLKFSEFLADVMERFQEVKKNQDYQFEQLVNDLKIKRESGRNPLFDVMFVFMNVIKFRAQGTSFRMAPYKINNQISKFDMTMFAEELDDEISFTLEYCTSLFTRDTMERLSRHYMNLIDIITANPSIKISDINLLSEDERKKYIVGFNSTDNPYTDNTTIDKIFDGIAESLTDNPAVAFENVTLTYRELREKSNILAGYLNSNGVGKGSIVPIIMERSPEFIISVLGVIKAGAAFLPIDNIYPRDRIEYMLSDSKANVIITNGIFEENSIINGKIININNDIWMGEDCRQKSNCSPDDVVYVIYTSGSTGKPKGVMIEHRNLLNYIRWAAKVYCKNTPSNFPLYTSISFDLTITSIFTPLLLGGSIIVYKEDEKELTIRNVLKDNRVDVIKMTPAHMKLIFEMDNSKSNIKTMIVGGENLGAVLAGKIYESFNHSIDIYNEYGPTEATVGCMIYKYDYTYNTRGSVPIGHPADNVKIYILDKYLNPVPVNVEGEIYISGSGVGRGYLNRPEITNERFIPDPFEPEYRMYKTGDMAKMLSSREVEYTRRCDEQVKVRGYRIEIGEIEKNLIEIDYIKDAVVLVKEDNIGNKGLYAYLISEEKISPQEIRSALASKLPNYMLPLYYFTVDKFPLTHNGKIDKETLIKMEMTIDEIIADEDQSDELKTIQIEIWKKILNVPHVSINDNYFTLGGDSIKAIQIVSRLSSKGINLNIKDILNYQTIREISRHISETTVTYEQGILDGEVGLNPIQTWFMMQHFKNPNHYNQSVTVRFKQDVDVKKLEEAFNTLIRHHDALRLNYDPANNTLFFNNAHLDNHFVIEEYDTLGFTNEDQELELEKIGSKLKSGFDISCDLLVKAAVITLNDSSKSMLITIHHLVVDGVSWRIILEDLYNAYASIVRGGDITLPPKTASLKDWYDRLIEYTDNEIDDEEKEYLKIEDANEFEFEFDNTDGYKAIHIKENLDSELTGYLIYDANKAYNTRPVDLMVTALAEAYKAWKGMDNVKVELESHGRNFNNINVSRTVGWFTMMYPVILKTDIENIDGQIKYVKEKLRNVPNNGFDYGVIKYMREKRTGCRGVRFNYLGEFGDEIENELFGSCELSTGSDISLENHLTINIEINCMIVDSILNIQAVFNGSIYDETECEKFLNIYKQKLEEILKYTMGLDDIYFTPSDFDAADISQQDIDMLFQ